MEKHPVGRLDRESSVVELDEHELLGLFWMPAEAVVDGRDGEEVLAHSMKTECLGLCGNAPQECVFDCRELPAVAVPPLSVLDAPVGLWVLIEC